MIDRVPGFVDLLIEEAVRAFIGQDRWTITDLLGLAKPHAESDEHSTSGCYMLIAVKPEARSVRDVKLYIGSSRSIAYRLENHTKETVLGLLGRRYHIAHFRDWCDEHQIVPKTVLLTKDVGVSPDDHFNFTVEAVLISIFDTF